MYVGSDASSMFALKYARDMSMAEICVLCSDLGSRTCRRLPSMSVAANYNIVRSDSSGGVGEKRCLYTGLSDLSCDKSRSYIKAPIITLVDIHPSDCDWGLAGPASCFLENSQSPHILRIEEVEFLLPSFSY